MPLKQANGEAFYKSLSTRSQQKRASAKLAPLSQSVVRSENGYNCPDRHTFIKVDDVFVDHAYAAV